MESLKFEGLGLHEPILRALREENYLTPTPIQAQSIPSLMLGRDMLGIAQTGTGKTAAFALPILHRLCKPQVDRTPRGTRALILAPTRELAIQIDEGFKAYGRHLGLKHAVIFGGVGQNPQVNALARGVDILTATPGRLIDLMGQGHIRLDRVEVFVLDEADRMLDMGFMPDVKRVVAALPKQRQSLLFSATMPDNIAHLAQSLLTDPLRVEITPAATTVERIQQKLYYVTLADKLPLLTSLMKKHDIRRVIVFTRTKHKANQVAEHLSKAGFGAAAIHGNKSQGARQTALLHFREGKIRALVATDIAARGIDVDNVSHVINYELPNEPESYVHRIGRTARAGAEGVAMSFCSGEERGYLRTIERTTKKPLDVVESQPYHTLEQEVAPPPQGGGRRGGGGFQRRDGGGGGGRPAQGGRPGSAKPQGGKPQGQRAAQGRPQGRPQGGKPGGGRPQRRAG
ncbi:MAG: DEAD/DEAH box helicase [Alphaproteobacteria bacterium]|nr:DEAD/DEAH box helicase [Alphaproteobacteria bacterium]